MWDRTEPPARPPDSGGVYLALVAVLAPQVDTWERMLADHTRDPQGYCAAKVCREGGTGQGRFIHPCPSRVLALRARQAHRGDR